MEPRKQAETGQPLLAHPWQIGTPPGGPFRPRSWAMPRIVLLGVGVLAAAGCNRSGLPANVPVQTRAQLQAFSSCSDFESYVEDTAVAAMRLQIDQLRQPWMTVMGVDGVPAATTGPSVP